MKIIYTLQLPGNGKGDLVKNDNHMKNKLHNNLKIVYVYEGIVKRRSEK